VQQRIHVLELCCLANIGFEYQGIQHYKPQKQWGGEEAFKKQRLRDLEKKRLCAENKTHLIEISCTEVLTENLIRQKLAAVNLEGAAQP